MSRQLRISTRRHYVPQRRSRGLAFGKCKQLTPTYHLTDIVSFLRGAPDSSGTLCLYDLRGTWPPFYDILRWKSIFTDLFSSYLEDTDFDMSKGSMFRLKLKKDCIKRDSELSYQAATLKTIDRLFARFLPDLFI